MKHLFAKSLPVFVLMLFLAPPAWAQPKDQFLRTNPKFVETFREVVAKPSSSTVRILCDGKDTALGMVVGADGWILTKANDLKGNVTCKLKSGGELWAKIVGIHKEHDLALLKIEARDLTPVEFAASKELPAGSWVAGAGLGIDPVAVGVVSVSTRKIANPGPTFTVDASKSGFLGVNLEPAEGGVRVVRIETKSAAEKAGLKIKDTIIALNGRTIPEVEAFILEMSKKKPGDEVTLKVRRDEEELDIKATLGKRPPNMSRGDFQNKMGSELSSRRSGYPTILQHDSVVKPADCGGPIVDLDGRVIGINICRAGRVESWAVPSEVVQAVLADLKSGKLAPPPAPEELPKPAPAENKAKPGEEKTKAVDALLGLMKQRLELSVDVARFKFANKLEVTDGKREEKLLARLLQAADEAGVDKNHARAFFTAQFAASRQLQEDLHARWGKSDKTPATKDIPDLKTTLRPKIEQVSLELVAAFAKAQPFLSETATHQTIRERAAQSLQSDAITAAVRAKALDGWLVPK